MTGMMTIMISILTVPNVILRLDSPRKTVDYVDFGSAMTVHSLVRTVRNDRVDDLAVIAINQRNHKSVQHINIRTQRVRQMKRVTNEQRLIILMQC